MYYVYILISKDGKRTYTGFTSDLEKRLSAHNNGEVKSSKSFRPYEILHIEEFSTSSEAKQRELFYKSPTGRRRLKLIVEDWRRLKSAKEMS